VNKLTISILLLALLLGVLFITHLTTGFFSINLWSYLTNETSLQETAILENIRLPRAIFAILAGAALAISGALLQGIFRNPLASSGIIGTDSGAMLGAITAIFFGLTNQTTIGFFAFTSATFITLVVYFLSFQFQQKRSDLVVVILTGIAMSALCSAIASILLTISLEDWDMGKRMVLWSFGSLEHTNWDHIKIILPVFVIGCLLCIPNIKNLNLLSLGDETAKSLGVKVEKTHFFSILISSLLAGIIVSITGMIGFIGLVCPHIGRLMFGNNHLKLIPLSALIGAIFLLAGDTIVLYLKSIYQVDLKIGILTSLIGVPFFLSMILKRKFS
jgi:iron complex transport system permease protein